MTSIAFPLTRRSALFAASLLALSIASPALTATPDTALVIAQNIDDIVTIDPATAYEFTSGEYVTNAYDKLVSYDAADPATLTPALAESWEVDVAAKSITFKLREGVTFTSGNPLRAEDVKGSYARVLKLNKAPAFILAGLGWTVDNLDEMITTAEGSVTLRWAGEFSPSYVLNVLAAGVGAVVDMETVMAKEVDGDLGHAWLNSNSAGTGAFKLQTFRPGEAMMLLRNDSHFRGAPAMERVMIRHVAEAATQRLLLESGDVDMAKNLSSDQVAGLEGKEGLRIETYPQNALHWIAFNQKHEALTNPALWEASRWLVDYKGMTDTFLKGQMRVHQAFWPAGFPGSYDETPYSYDPEKAKQILKDGGVELPLKIELDVINSAPYTDMAAALQQSFAPAGINFEIQPGTGAQVITKYRARTHQGMLLYWGPDFMDPHSNAKAFAYNADNADDKYASTTTWRNAWMPPEAMNKATLAALAEQDGEKRNAMYVELQKEVQATAPFTIMFQAEKQLALADRVTGYVNGPSPHFVYYRLVTKN